MPLARLTNLLHVTTLQNGTRTMTTVTRPALFQDPREKAIHDSLTPEQIKNVDVELGRKLIAERVDEIGLTDRLEQLSWIASKPATIGKIEATCEESFGTLATPPLVCGCISASIVYARHLVSFRNSDPLSRSLSQIPRTTHLLPTPLVAPCSA